MRQHVEILSRSTRDAASAYSEQRAGLGSRSGLQADSANMHTFRGAASGIAGRVSARTFFIIACRAHLNPSSSSGVRLVLADSAMNGILPSDFPLTVSGSGVARAEVGAVGAGACAVGAGAGAQSWAVGAGTGAGADEGASRDAMARCEVSMTSCNQLFSCAAAISVDSCGTAALILLVPRHRKFWGYDMRVSSH